jgi:hypothetical protein
VIVGWGNRPRERRKTELLLVVVPRNRSGVLAANTPVAATAEHDHSFGTIIVWLVQTFKHSMEPPLSTFTDDGRCVATTSTNGFHDFFKEKLQLSSLLVVV